MVSLNTPGQVQLDIAKSLRRRRLELGYTQKTLSEKSTVALATLRKFERTGNISLESFLKLALVLRVLDELASVVKPQHEYKSIDEMLAAKTKPERQRGRS